VSITLKKSESTIEEEQNFPTEFSITSKSIASGGMRINAEAEHITRLAEQLSRVFLLEPNVRDAAIQKALLTTKTMTNLLTLLGSVNPVTSSDTKS
jgi:hypothetical protein